MVSVFRNGFGYETRLAHPRGFEPLAFRWTGEHSTAELWVQMGAILVEGKGFDAKGIQRR